MSSFDPLWVPLLTHYEEKPKLTLDRRRTSAHIKHLSDNVWQYLVAGTTGDGWEIPDDLLLDWISFIQDDEVFNEKHNILFGAFSQTTEGVIAKAGLIEEAIQQKPLRANYVGLTICAPIAPNATQEEITTHFERIIEATISPLAIYQLPQIVKCEIAPKTLQRLTEKTGRIILVKDTSGEDIIANSKLPMKGTKLLRGAEGDYSEQISGNGNYDGLLLSTANCFQSDLRNIINKLQDAELYEIEGNQNISLSALMAERDSIRLSTLVHSLFEVATSLPDGNAFSNINRAVDHIFCHGSDWESKNVKLVSGNVLDKSFIAKVASMLNDANYNTGTGYMT